MPAGELSVRPLTGADMDRLLEIDNIAFLEGPSSPEMRQWQRRVLEVDRSIGAFDGQTQVGGASIFTLRLTVPDGRQVPLAGVTWVSMLPTHRRRGGLTKMMRHQLDDLHEAGAEPIAGLTANDPAIYGRYGYGRATESAILDSPPAQRAATAAGDRRRDAAARRSEVGRRDLRGEVLPARATASRHARMA